MSSFMLENATVLITGATGMIGSCAAKKILDSGKNNTVIALVRNPSKAKSVFAEYSDCSHLIILEHDICNPISYDGSVDYIIHTAGVTGGSKQHVDLPMRTIQTAIDGTIHVLDFGAEKNTKGIVYLSSLEVYGDMQGRLEDIKETDGGYIDVTNVRSSYSESKRMCECICASYAKQYGLRTMIARLTATFGEGVAYQDGRVFAQFARSVIEGKDIVLKSTGETVRNYCDVEDCADALLLLLTKGESGQAYNIANQQTQISIKDLAEKFIALYPQAGINLRFDLQDDISKLGYIQKIHSCLNSEKMMQLGWKPKFDLDEMIVHLVDSMRSNRG